MQPLKMVQIGAGGFSRVNHEPCLVKLAAGPEPRISMEAVCDLDAERAEAFRADFGYERAYTDIETMLREVEPDLIYSMVQPAATAGVLEQVLPMGLPTFTEKPPGITIEQAQRLAQLADKHNVISYVAFNRRRVPGIVRLKQWANENGPVRYVRAEMLRNRRVEPEFAIGTAIHSLDCLRYLCGDVAEVETRSKPYEHSKARDYLIRLQFESGVIADLAVLVCAGLSRERYLMQVDDAMMEATVGTHYTSPFCSTGERAYSDNAVLFDDPAEEESLIAGGFWGEHEAFLSAVASGELPSCCLQDAHKSLALGVAVFEGYCGRMDDFVPAAENPY